MESARLWTLTPTTRTHCRSAPFPDYPWVEPVSASMIITNEAAGDGSFERLAAEMAADQVKSRCIDERRTMLSPITIVLSDGHHSDFFTANKSIVLAEAITLNRYGKMSWPTFTPFPRLVAARGKAQSGLERIRNAWRALRGEELASTVD